MGSARPSYPGVSRRGRAGPWRRHLRGVFRRKAAVVSAPNDHTPQRLASWIRWVTPVALHDRGRVLEPQRLGEAAGGGERATGGEDDVLHPRRPEIRRTEMSRWVARSP